MTTGGSFAQGASYIPAQPQAQYVVHQPGYPGGQGMTTAGSFAQVGVPATVTAVPPSMAGVPMMPMQPGMQPGMHGVPADVRPSREIPDPASIEKQKADYERQIEVSFEQAKQQADIGAKQAREAMQKQAELDIATYTAQVQQRLKQQELQLEQKLQQENLARQQMMMQQRAVLEQQASSLAMEYQQSKMREEWQKQQDTMHMEMIGLQQRMEQEMQEHHQQAAALTAQHAQQAQQLQMQHVRVGTHPGQVPHQQPGVPTATAVVPGHPQQTAIVHAPPTTALQPVYTATTGGQPIQATYGAYGAPPTIYASPYAVPTMVQPGTSPGRHEAHVQHQYETAGMVMEPQTAGGTTYVLAAPNANGNMPPSAVSAVYGQAAQVYGQVGPSGSAQTMHPAGQEVDVRNAMFDVMDQNQDGVISRAEFTQAMHR